MTAQSWQVAHLADIRRRLAWLSAQPEGVLLDVASPLHHIRVVKQAGQPGHRGESPLLLTAGRPWEVGREE